MPIVETCWGPREVTEESYWHLIPRSGFWRDTFYHNVRVGRGALLSVSAGIEAEPHIEGAQTGYALSHIQDPKEHLFEAVRIEKYPTRPPRLKNLYVFENKELVERAQREWFASDPKVSLRCHILKSSVIHRADTTWLNCPPERWSECAENYWGGTMGLSPFPEILVHGVLYFPEWGEFPDSTK